MILITSEKNRSVLHGAKTEQELITLLRSHKIKYAFTTETGFLSVRIPCRKGLVRAFKIASRSCPFVVRFEKKGEYYDFRN